MVTSYHNYDRVTVLGDIPQDLHTVAAALGLNLGNSVALTAGHRAFLLEGDLQGDSSALNLALRNALPDAELAVQAAHGLPQVAVFDMDSTLIDCECIDELAAAHGVGEEVAAVTEAAMRGELDFSASFAQRLGKLNGLERQAVEDLIARLPINPGVPEMAAGLKGIGCRLVIASGGFTDIADRLGDQLGFDRVVANQLEWDGDQLTGRYIGEIVDGQRKAAVLAEECQALSQSPDNPVTSLSVGDGANDLLMIAAASLGVAYHAKPVVAAAAPAAISQYGMDAVLAYVGLAAE